ncbi:hypothetical protein ABK040_000633 [Willaertia magna]
MERKENIHLVKALHFRKISHHPTIKKNSGKSYNNYFTRLLSQQKKLNAISLQTLLQKQKNNEQFNNCIFLGFTRSGNYLIGYKYLEDLNNLMEEDITIEYKNILFLFFEFDFFNLELKLELPFVNEDYNLENNFLEIPKYCKQIILQKNIYFNNYFPNKVIPNIHCHFSEIFDENLFFIYLYCKINSLEKIYCLKILQNLLNNNLIKKGKIYGLILKYISTDVNVSLFNINSFVMKINIYNNCNNIYNYFIAIPTSTTIELFIIEPKIIKENFTICNPYCNNNCNEEDNNLYFVKGLSDNISLEYIPIMEMSKDCQVSFLNCKCFYHFNVEYFILDKFKNQSILDYNFKIVKSHQDLKQLFIIIVIDIKLEIIKKIERNIIYGMIELNEMLQNNYPNLNILYESKNIIDTSKQYINTTLCINNLCLIVLKRDPLKEPLSIILNNENMFKSGESLKSIDHPHLPFSLTM